MSKKNIFVRFGGVFPHLWKALKSHPVELIVLLHAALAVAVNSTSLIWVPAGYAAFAATAAFCLSFYRRRSPWWHVAYWAVLPIYALAALLPAQWYRTTECQILVAVLPLAYLLARLPVDGRHFGSRFFSMVRSGVVSLGIGLAIFVLLMLILASVELLFSLDSWEWYSYIAAFSFVLLAPMLFISMEGSGEEPVATRLEEAIVNWVLTPALLIYNAVLYVYLATIVIGWELPKGSVATMVSAFMVVAVAVIWLRPRLQHQPLAWYFRRFAFFALPLVALYWVAVGYRIGQYGITVDRCVLLAAGVVMTLWTVPNLIRSMSLGYATAALVVTLGVVLAIGGPLSARKVALRSQVATVRHHADKLGMLNDDGRLKKTEPVDADSIYRADHRAIYQAMKYVQSDLKDTLSLQRELGTTAEDYLDNLSKSTAEYAKAWRVDDDYYEPDDPIESGCYVNIDRNNDMVGIDGYSSMIVDVYFCEDTIPVPGGSISSSEVLAAQLAKVGYTTKSCLNCDRLQNNSETLCHYCSPDSSLVIVFQRLYINQRGDSNYIESGRVRYALKK